MDLQFHKYIGEKAKISPKLPEFHLQTYSMQKQKKIISFQS